MTSMQAVKGSRTHPNCSDAVPNWSHSKFTTSRNGPCGSGCKVAANAQHERRKENANDPIASVAARRRAGCLQTEITAAARSGSTGISHKFLTIQIMSAFEAVDLLHVRRLVMTIDGNNQSESDRGF